jgi:hypothetical protein
VAGPVTPITNCCTIAERSERLGERKLTVTLLALNHLATLLATPHAAVVCRLKFVAELIRGGFQSMNPAPRAMLL